MMESHVLGTGKNGGVKHSQAVGHRCYLTGNIQFQYIKIIKEGYQLKP